MAQNTDFRMGLYFFHASCTKLVANFVTTDTVGGEEEIEKFLKHAVSIINYSQKKTEKDRKNCELIVGGKRLFFRLSFICIQLFAPMLKFLKIFMIAISLYFVLHTVIVFGLFDGLQQTLVSSIKDLSWFIFCVVVASVYPQQTWNYIRKTKYLIATLVAMACLGVAVTLNAHGRTIYALKNTIIGLKYGRYFMVVFRSAGMVGYNNKATSYQLPVSGVTPLPRYHTTNQESKAPEASSLSSQKASKHRSIEALEARIAFIVRLSRFILLGGFVIQGSKVLFPELWYALGFGGLDVYKAGVAPPLYYLTKQNGVMRYSGLFSGPNNFAFWLIGMTPLLRYVAGNAKKRFVKWGARIGLLCLGALNLGRVLLVGWIAEILPSFAHNKRIKKNKFLVGLGIGLIIGLFGYITYLKRESTTEHFALGIDAIHKFLARPWGYGLGSSGPGVHRNGSLLPENYYLQLALDYGRLGPVCFTVFWATVLRCYGAHGLPRAELHSIPDGARNDSIAASQHRSIETYYRLFVTGFVGMLIAGGFLHVFEDSMVNYLFFVPRGIVFGYQLYKKTNKNADA